MKDKIINKEDWKKIRPWLILGSLLIIMYLVCNNFLMILSSMSFVIAVLQPLIIAIVIAFVLNIPMMFIERNIKKRVKINGFIYQKSRSISLTLTIVLAIVIIFLIISIIFPRIIDTLIQLFGNMGKIIEDIFANIDNILKFFNINYSLENSTQINQFIDMPWDQIFKNTITILGNSTKGLLDNAASLTSTFFLWFMSFMFSLYLLNGKETLLRQFRELLLVIFKERKATSLFVYGKQANTIFKNFVTGQLLEAVIIGSIYYIAMRIFGFPYPELIAMIIAVFSLVPVFGPMCAMAIGGLLILSVDPIQALWFLVFFQVLSQIEDNLIYPRVVGNSVGLPGLWVMLSIFVLGDLFGLIGMIIAVPTTAFVYTVLSDRVHYILKKRKTRVDYKGNIFEEKQ